MSKKIGKHRISPQKMKDLEGFQDVLDLVYEERPTVKKGSESSSQSFETMAYLEEEEERLRRLEIIFSSAIPNAMAHPQEDHVILELIDQRDTLVSELTEHMIKADSALNQNLNSIFKTIFPKD